MVGGGMHADPLVSLGPPEGVGFEDNSDRGCANDNHSQQGCPLTAPGLTGSGCQLATDCNRYLAWLQCQTS